MRENVNERLVDFISTYVVPLSLFIPTVMFNSTELSPDRLILINIVLGYEFVFLPDTVVINHFDTITLLVLHFFSLVLVFYYFRYRILPDDPVEYISSFAKTAILLSGIQIAFLLVINFYQVFGTQSLQVNLIIPIGEILVLASFYIVLFISD